MDYSILLGIEEIRVKSKESLFIEKIKKQSDQAFIMRNSDYKNTDKPDQSIRHSHSINMDFTVDI